MKIFKELKDDLKEAITLSYPDATKTICVFTDASHRFYAGVVTQCDKKSLELLLKNRNMNRWFSCAQSFEKLVYIGLLSRKKDLQFIRRSRSSSRCFMAILMFTSLYSLCNHHFITAYCPWANGSVECTYREVFCSFKALRSEWKLSEKDWPAITECVQSVLNHAPLLRLGLRNK